MWCRHSSGRIEDPESRHLPAKLPCVPWYSGVTVCPNRAILPHNGNLAPVRSLQARRETDMGGGTLGQEILHRVGEDFFVELVADIKQARHDGTA